MRADIIIIIITTTTTHNQDIANSTDSFDTLAIHLYWPLHMVSSLDVTQFQYIVDKYKFLLVGQYWCVHL